jgi:hypothetical protein
VLGLLFLAFLAGCPRPPTISADETLPDKGVGTAHLQRIPMPGLRDVACDEAAGCVALAGDRLVDLRTLAPVGDPVPADHDVVARVGDTWVTSRAPVPETVDEPPPLAEETEQFRLQHNRAVANGWRAAFSRILVLPNGLVTWARGTEGTGQLVRTAGSVAFVRIPAASSPVSYPAWLALHPTGMEAYLLPWPSDTLTAFDPGRLATRWSLALGGAGVGLFVDGDGRWLLAQVGTDDTDRFVDWPLPAFVADTATDPLADERVRAFPRPPAQSTVLVDLSRQDVAVRVAGAFRGWASMGASRVLATDREVVIFEPPEAS